MTTLTIELPAKTDFASPVARLLHTLAQWQERRHQNRIMRASLDAVPDDLRKDIGLDGGAAPHSAGRNGRTFITNGHPDSTLSDWRW